MKFINNYTGEIYNSVWHMITCIVDDMVHYKACRTIKMFNIDRYNA